MRRFLLIGVVGCAVFLAANIAWSECLERVAEVTYDITGQPPSMGSATAVAVSGSYAYYNVGPVLHVVDVTVPSDPRVMGEVTLSGSIRAIAVDGSMAYVAMGSAGLSVVDISDPLAPEEMSVIPPPSGQDVAVSGGYLYVASLAGIQVFDLADPAYPSPAGHWTASQQVRALAVASSPSCTYAFVASPADGVHIIDVTNPLLPIEVGHYSLISGHDIAVSGGHALVTDRDYLHVLDVSNPSTPVRVGEVDYAMPWEVPAPSLAVSHSRVYVGRFPRLAMVDLNPPSVPVVNCEVLWDYPTGHIVWAEEYLYVPIVDVWAQRSGLAILHAREGALADFGSIECDDPPVGALSFAE